MNYQQTESTLGGRLLILGAGAVAEAALPLLLQHFGQAWHGAVVMAPEGEGRVLAARHGADFRQMTLTPDNYAAELRRSLNAGDFLLNLALAVDSLDLLAWTQDHGVRYLDTSLESWPGQTRTRREARQGALRHARSGRPTAVVAHGANPGLVTHFVKQGLCEWSRIEAPPPTRNGWAELSRLLGIQLIQSTEFDYHESAVAPAAGEFVNTWSARGLVAELGAAAELGWGDHEEGPLPQIHSAIAQEVLSWTPGFGEFHGRLIAHHEAISINELLTPEIGAGRPTVYYAVRPCPSALTCLSALPGAGEGSIQSYRVMGSDLRYGGNELGALMLSASGAGYWFGSTLALAPARELVASANATSLQVAAGVLGGLVWAIENPSRGVVEAEDMDFRRVLDLARPWLGRLSGIATRWRPARAADLGFGGVALAKNRATSKVLPQAL